MADELTPEQKAQQEAEAAKKKAEQEVEAAKIFETILFEGVYTETFTFRKKMQFTLRSRSVEEVMKINDYMETKEFKTQGAAMDERLFQHLAHAIVALNGKDYSKSTHEEKTAALRNLPAPVMQILVRNLSTFDNKVQRACEEGEENFTQTPD